MEIERLGISYDKHAQELAAHVKVDSLFTTLAGNCSWIRLAPIGCNLETETLGSFMVFFLCSRLYISDVHFLQIENDVVFYCDQVE